MNQTVIYVGSDVDDTPNGNRGINYRFFAV